MKFYIPDMSCGHCTAAITKEIYALDSKARVASELEGHTVEIETDLPETAVIDAIKTAGFEATPK